MRNELTAWYKVFVYRSVCMAQGYDVQLIPKPNYILMYATRGTHVATRQVRYTPRSNQPC
jgi:hypothetical protein